MIDKIGVLYQDKLIEKEDELKNKAIELFKKEIECANKYDVDERSNILYPTDGNLDINNYETLGDFFEEFIGDTNHKYGGQYLQYYDLFDGLISEHNKSVMGELIDELLEESEDDIIEYIKSLGYDVVQIKENIEKKDDLIFTISINLPDEYVPMISETMNDLRDIKIEEIMKL